MSNPALTFPPLEITPSQANYLRRLRTATTLQEIDELKVAYGRGEDPSTVRARLPTDPRIPNFSTESERLAYLEAIERIQKAFRKNDLELDFSDLKTLSKLPDFIGGAANISHLDLRNTKITDLAPLANMTSMRKLLLTDTPVADISALASLTALTNLALQRTSVSDLTPLTGLTIMEILNLTNTPVTNIEPLASMTSMIKLSLRNTRVSEIEILKDMTALKELSLQGTKVENVTSLKHIRKLKIRR